MKGKTLNPIRRLLLNIVWILAITLFLLTCFYKSSAQLCTSPLTTIYGITDLADIHPINVITGSVSPKINPAYTGNPPSYANAMAYSNLNGKLYYFKRNVYVSTPEFVSFDPAFNTYAYLAACPSTIIVNLGCMTKDGTGYYALDAFANLYYYGVATNTWTLISNKLRDGGTSLFLITTKDSTIYGDMAIDGSGNLWMLVSGKKNYGLYELPAPLPTTTQSTNMQLTQIIAPTTLPPGGNTFGGIALTVTGKIFLSTNTPDNKLYQLESNKSLTLLSTMSLNGIGNDLTSCNFPMVVLPYHPKVKKLINENKQEFEIWPTVVTNQLQIQTENCMISNFIFSIYDQSGRVVKQFKLDNDLSTIDISTLQAGTYFANLQSDNGKIYNQKIVKL